MKKNNWKCIIGATLLTPFCIVIFLALLLAISWGMDWLIQIKIKWIIGIVILLVLFLCVWVGLFEHCKERWSKKEGKTMSTSGSIQWAIVHGIKVWPKMKCLACKHYDKENHLSRTLRVCKECVHYGLRSDNYTRR